MGGMLIINNIYTATGKTDPVVGISIARVAGDDNFGIYCAKLGPYKRVGAHYHKKGVETYHVAEGRGTMHTGTVDTDSNVIWNSPVHVKKGDAFNIKEGEVHQLINTGDEELLVIFGCPASHLADDRYIVRGVQE